MKLKRAYLKPKRTLQKKKSVPARQPKLTWNPVRKGRVFCSSACGHHCTWEEYQTALKKAQALLRLMKTSGWKIHVHENVGWHYSIVRENLGQRQLEVTGENKRYRCSFFNGTPMDVFVKETYEDPNAAVEAQLHRIREVIMYWKAVLSEVSLEQ